VRLRDAVRVAVVGRDHVPARGLGAGQHPAVTLDRLGDRDADLDGELLVEATDDAVAIEQDWSASPKFKVSVAFQLMVRLSSWLVAGCRHVPLRFRSMVQDSAGSPIGDSGRP